MRLSDDDITGGSGVSGEGVADGGANDVLQVNPRTGNVSTIFVPPTVKPSQAPAC